MGRGEEVGRYQTKLYDVMQMGGTRGERAVCVSVRVCVCVCEQFRLPDLSSRFNTVREDCRFQSQCVCVCVCVSL